MHQTPGGLIRSTQWVTISFHCFCEGFHASAQNIHQKNICPSQVTNQSSGWPTVKSMADHLQSKEVSKHPSTGGTNTNLSAKTEAMHSFFIVKNSTFYPSKTCNNLKQVHRMKPFTQEAECCSAMLSPLCRWLSDSRESTHLPEARPFIFSWFCFLKDPFCEKGFFRIFSQVFSL